MNKKSLTTTKTTQAVKAEIVSAEKADKKLVDDAVEWIRNTAFESIRKTSVEVGDYILKKFFDDTADFPVSKTWLNNAVGVAIMTRQLPSEESAFKLLPPSLQETLLPLRDPERVEKIAEKITEEELTLRQARQAVARERAKLTKDDGRGRPPTPVIVKTLNRSLKLFTFEGSKRSFTKADVEELDDDQKKEAIKSAEALVDKMKALVEKLKSS